MTPERSIDVTFRPITEAEARAIAAWRYEGPYAFYNAPAGAADDPEYLRELLAPDNSYYAAIDSQGELIGFLGFGAPAQVGITEEREAAYGGEQALDVGLGLRPDLTGQGLGLAFVEAGLAFARERFAPARFRLSVAAFNRRAIRVYERAGFRRLRAMILASSGGPCEFVVMVRDAGGVEGSKVQGSGWGRMWRQSHNHQPLTFDLQPSTFNRDERSDEHGDALSRAAGADRRGTPRRQPGPGWLPE